MDWWRTLYFSKLGDELHQNMWGETVVEAKIAKAEYERDQARNAYLDLRSECASLRMQNDSLLYDFLGYQDRVVYLEGEVARLTTLLEAQEKLRKKVSKL